MALTATATERVREDVLQHLQLREPATYLGSFNRPNLTYRVLPKSGPYQQVLDLVRRRPSESGIVYCQSRRSSEYVAERLNEDGIKARPYHAGLEADERRRHQDLFRRDDVQVICATIAFGMGIDKPNIRFIAHYDLPKSLENYYQETGRAGRDGLPSECLLLYGPGDAVKYSRFIDEKPDAKEREIARQQLAEMEGFAASSECRRRALLRYFGEEFCAENCGACDNCLSPRQMFDATEAARKLLAAVFRIKEKSGFSLGLTHVADVLAGANTEKVRRLGHHELKAHGGGKERSRSEWVAIGRELLRLRYLMQDANRYNVLELTPEGRRLMAGQAASKQVLPCDEGLFERLRRLRKTLADQRNVAAYVIFSDVALRQMAREYPANEAEFGRISGVGRSKLSEFGTIFMREIAAYLASNPRQTFTDDVPTVPVRKMRLGDTHRETLRRFGEGQRIEEIAAERGLAASTIWGHLADAAEAGEEIDAGRLLAQGEREQIIAAIDAKGGGNLRGAFEALEERHPYGLLRIVRALCDRGAEGEGATAATNPAEGCASASSRPGRTEASPAKSPASAPSPA